ncbi:hypothetical protein HP456_00130 [Bacillus haikouensis]|nr:hypothetical protein [Bacillus haikouensis]NQD64328.1 hypothetical protein [Bacillus haikouensis]
MTILWVLWWTLKNCLGGGGEIILTNEMEKSDLLIMVLSQTPKVLFPIG